MAEGKGGNHSNFPVSDDKERFISAAVRFINNPAVQKTSFESQKAFLRSRGFTDEEIELVLKRAASSVEDGGSHAVQTSFPLPPPVPPRDYNSSLHRNSGSMYWDIVKSILVVGGITYGLYQLYMKFIHCNLFGGGDKIKKPNDSQPQSSDLLVTIRAINSSIKELQEQLKQKELAETFTVTKQIGELKAEVASVKALFLARNQFAPPVLQTVLVPPSIPSWQLESADDKNSEEEGNKHCKEEETQEFKCEDTTQDIKDDSESEIRTLGSVSSENDPVTTSGSDSSLVLISKNEF